MTVVLKGYTQELPIMNSKSVQSSIQFNCLPDVVEFEDMLKEYGLKQYRKTEFMNTAVLNEILCGYSDLSDLEFKEVCGILESKFSGDLWNIGCAIKYFQRQCYEFIHKEVTSTYDSEEIKDLIIRGYQEVQGGLIRFIDESHTGI